MMELTNCMFVLTSVLIVFVKEKQVLENALNVAKKLWTSYLDGLCMVYHCSSCGMEVIGASFFPPCMLDNDRYTITVKQASKKTYVKLAKMFSTNVVSLKTTLDIGNSVSKTVRPFEAEKIIRVLTNLDIKYEVSPNLFESYSELITCELKENLQKFVSYHGDNPMNVIWKLENKIPAKFYRYYRLIGNCLIL